MKISIDTETDTFDEAINAVYAAYGQVPAPTTDDEAATNPEEESNGYLPGMWTRRRLRKMVEWLGDSDAAESVRYIAHNATAVSIDVVIAHMAEYTGQDNFDGKAIGGRMASVGFGRNRIGGGVGPLYETDYNNRMYRMDKNLAAVLLEEMAATADE